MSGPLLPLHAHQSNGVPPNLQDGGQRGWVQPGTDITDALAPELHAVRANADRHTLFVSPPAGPDVY